MGCSPIMAEIMTTIGILCKHLSAVLKHLGDSVTVQGSSGKTSIHKRTPTDVIIFFYKPLGCNIINDTHAFRHTSSC